MILWHPEHRARLLACIREADRIIIATGILGGGPIVDALAAVAGSVSVLVVTGCGGGLTRRDAVERLREAGGEVRVVDDRTGGLFHAKVYAVAAGGAATAIVGSANLSAGGFGANDEAMAEVTLTTADLEALEARLRKAGPLLHDLADLPTPPRSSGRMKSPPRGRIPLGEVLGMSWSDYLDAVLHMDAWWKSRPQPLDVFAEGVGWLPTIDALQAIPRKPLAALPELARRILVGKRAEEDVAYFGDFNATPVRDTVLHPTKPDNIHDATVIDAIRARVGSVGDPLSLDDAVAAFDELTAIKGVWLGVAGRLLLSVRPDVFVSVNEGSRSLLVSETGLRLPKQAPPKRRCADYCALLARVQEAPWYAAPKPSDGEGEAVWKARAALIDVFVYEPGENRWD